MKKILKALFLGIFVLTFGQTYATHVVAADLTYACYATGQYTITLNLYRNCTSAVRIYDTAFIHYSSVQCGVAADLTLHIVQPVQNITDTCPGQPSACSSGSGYGVQKITYTGILTLPVGCGNDWVLSYTNCNRNTAITNITNPGGVCLYIKDSLNNTFSGCGDHSPTFSLNPVAFLCAGQLNGINQGGTDLDGDSLVYSLVAPEIQANTNVNYSGTYTASNPITGAFNFNSQTGQILSTPPIGNQVCVLKIRVTEYRNGVMIGTVERDMQVYVQPCVDTIPQLSSVITSSLPHSVNSVNIPACTSGCFSFIASTNNPDTSVHLTVSWTGQGQVPGATLVSNIGHRDSVVFCWSPTRANAGIHNINVTVRDNACPTPGQFTTAYTIYVPDPLPAGPDQTICQYSAANAQGTGAGTWTIMPFNPATTVIANPTSPTTLITGFTSPGRYNYIFTNGSCIDTMSIIVNVKPNAGVDKTICQFNPATMTASGFGKWTALNTNPTTTTITDTTLGSTTITGFSTVGTYRYVWKANGCTDTVLVIVNTKPNAGADQNICSSIGTATMAATGTGTWTAAASNPAVAVITNATSPTTTITGMIVAGSYTYYWTNGCSDTVVINVSNAPNGGPDQTICQYNTVTMAATGTGTWAAVGSNPSVTVIANLSLSTTTISGFNTAGIYRYLWSLGGSCVDTVLITVTAKPNAGQDQSICQYSSTAMAASGRGTWTASGSNPRVTTFTNDTIPTTNVGRFDSAGTYTYYWSFNGCVDTINIVVNNKPNAGSDQTICQLSTATMTAVGTGTWTASGSNPAAVTFTTATSPTTSATGFSAAGTYALYWSRNGCSDTVLVSVTAKPNAGADQSICQYTIATMTASGRGRWTTSLSNPRATAIANDTVATTSISGFDSAGVYTYYWTQNGCSDTVKITVKAKPNAGPDQSLCIPGTITEAATGTGTWSSWSGNPGTSVITTPGSATTTVSFSSTGGIYTFIWTNNGCSDSMNVQVIPLNSAGPDQTICQYNTATTNSTGIGNWTISASNPAVTVIANANADTTIISGFTVAGNYSYVWHSGICTDTMIVHVNAGPNGGADQTICQYTSTAMTATGTGTWGALPLPSVLTIANPTSPTTSVSGFIDSGTYTLFWSNAGCTDTVYVHVTAKPNAGVDQTICQFTSAKMNSTGVGTWTALSTNAATTIANPTSDTTLVTGFNLAGDYYYIWTSNGCTDTVKVSVTAKPNAGTDQTICQYTSARMHALLTGSWTSLSTNPIAANIVIPSLDSTIITGFTLPGTYGFVWNSSGCTDTVFVFVTAKPNAGTDQTICQYTSAVMTATGSGNWTASSTPSIVTFANDTVPTTSVSGFIDSGTYTLYWNKNGCTDTILIHVTAKPNAGADQTICQYTTAAMRALGVGTWTALLSNPHTTTFANANYDSTVISGFTVAGTYGFVWTSNGCTDTMNVFVTAKPNAGADQTICQYTTASMTAQGIGTWTALIGNPHATTFANANYDSTVISGFTLAGTYGFVWTSNGCTDTVNVFVTAKPNAGADQTICQYTTVKMNSVGIGSWTALGTNPIATTIVTPTSDTTIITGFTIADTYGYVWTSNGCTDTVNVFVTAKPNAGADQTICQYTTAAMTAQGSGTWTALATNAIATSFANANYDSTVISGFTIAGTYGFVWTSNGCTDTANVLVTAKPNAGADQTICQYTATAMTATGTGSWAADAGNPALITFVNTTSPTSSVSGFSAAGAYTFYWTSNGCTDTTLINVTAKPDAGADQSLCLPGSIITAAVGNGSWTALATNPAPTSFGNSTDPITTIIGFTAGGIYSYIWTVNGCTDTMSVNITPLAPAGPDQTICQYSTATTAAFGTGTWVALPGNPATTSFANTNVDTTIISGFSLAGTYGFIWTTGNACADTMYITVTSKPDAGPDQTICQYSNTVMTATGTGIWTLGINPAVVTFADSSSYMTNVNGFSAAGTYTFYWTVNGCTDTMQIAVTPKPNAGIDQTICQYSTATMTAIGSGTWAQELSNPAVVIFANDTIANTNVTGFATAGTYMLYWTRNGCTDTVLINVTTKPDAGADQSLCLPGTITTAASGIGTWSAPGTNPGVTSFSNNTDPAAIISGFTTGGIYNYVWTVNGCTDTMSVNITPLAPAGPDQNICQYNSIATAAYGTGTWSALAGNPAATTIANANADTTIISGFIAGGTYGFIWSTINSCTDTMYVIVTTKPDAGADQTICQYTSTIMNATGSGIWTSDASNPVSTTLSDTTSATSGVTGFTSAGTYTFYWSLNGCSDTILINVTAKPDAGADQTICQYSTTNMAATGAGAWTQEVGNPIAVTIADTSSATSSVGGFSLGGTYTFYWSNNGCTDTTIINVTAKPDAGTDQTICQYNVTALTATGTGIWTSGTNPAVVTFSNTASPTSSVTGFTLSGIYTFYWTLNGCSDTILINVTAKPNAGADQTICQFSTTNMLATGSGAWTQDGSNPIVITFADTSSATSSVGGFASSGSYTFYWSFNGCTDTMLINVTAKPDAGSDQTICQYSTTAMNASGAGAWTQGTNPAVVTFANTSLGTSVVSGFTAAGVYTFYWNVNGCNDTVVINVTAKPQAGADQTICQYSTTAMTATATGAWTQDAGNPIAVTIADTSSATSAVSGFSQGGAYTFYWSYNSCTDTVLINVTAKPDAGTDQSICQNTTASMTATGTGIWTAYNLNPATVTFANNASPITTVTGFTQPGTYLLYWTNNGCSDSVFVTVATASTLSVSGRGGICPGYNDTLTANASVTGGVYAWSPGGQSTQSIVVSPATTTTYTVTYTIAVCGTYTDTATVTVYPPMTLSQMNDTICIGSSVTLTATPSTAGGTYLWAPGGQSTSSISVSPASQTAYAVTYSLANCPTVRAIDTVSVTIPPTLSLRDTTVCQGNAATLTAIPSQSGGTYTWAPGAQTTQSITVTPLNSTQYTVSYGIPGSVCPPTIDTATIFVTPQPSLTVTNDSICFGQNAILTATPNIGGGTFLWTPTGNTTNTITVSPPSTATYNVVYTVPNCGIANGSGTVTVFQNPTLSLDSQNITCFGYTNGVVTPVITPASGSYSYNWSNGTHGAVDSNLTATGGPYYLTITDQHNCTATAGPINIVEPPQAFAEVMPGDTSVLQGNEVQLTSTFTGYPASAITGYSWTPTDGLSCINCPNPIVNTTTLTDSVAIYTLTVMYNNGCHVSALDTIHVLTGLAIGSAFTPNNDGNNDYFTFIALGVKDFHMTIYNRWGQTVYESSDPKAGWDGNYNGNPQPSEVYTYFITINNLNGSTVNRTGQVTLIR